MSDNMPDRIWASNTGRWWKSRVEAAKGLFAVDDEYVNIRLFLILASRLKKQIVDISREHDTKSPNTYWRGVFIGLETALNLIQDEDAGCGIAADPDTITLTRKELEGMKREVAAPRPSVSNNYDNVEVSEMYYQIGKNAAIDAILEKMDERVEQP